MPMPITTHASDSLAMPEAERQEHQTCRKHQIGEVSTSRPPCRSIIRPAAGPSNPDSNSAAEKMPKNQ